MYTPQENYKIKQTARETIRGRLWYFWQLYIILAVINIIASYLNKKLFGNDIAIYQTLISGEIPKEINTQMISIYYFMESAIALLQIPLIYGILHNVLMLIRGVRVDNPYSLMFAQYKTGKSFGKSIGVAFLSYIIIMLYTLLLVIPGIIKSLSYSLVPYLIHDEPNLSIRETLKKSQEIMRGYKGKLFMLMLSFIGWAILGALTFGILYIWLAPYMVATYTKFYDEVRRSYYNNDPAKTNDVLDDTATINQSII